MRQGAIKDIHEELLEELLKIALKNGGEYADIFIEYTRPLSIHLEDSMIEKISPGIEIGAGIRVIHNLRTSYAYTNDLSADSLRDIAYAVSEAVKNARQRDISEIDMTRVKPNVDFEIREYPDQVGLGEKIKLIEEADRVARSISKDIKQVTIIYRDLIQDILIGTSDGVYARDERVHTLTVINVIASDGEVLQTGYEPIGGFAGFELFEDQKIVNIAQNAARRASMMLSARKAPGGRMPVVISSEAGGTMIHEAIGHGLEADLAHEGLSVYAGKIGETIASPLITIVDDPTLPGKRGSFRIDDEGIPARKNVLVEKGVLKGYMYDRLTAMKDRTSSTGNGRRQSFRHRPIPRMTNTYIEPGKDDPASIISSVDNGFFVKKMGGGQVNTVTGEFVFEVSEGYLIEKGKIGEPVRGATLIGNGPEVLKTIDMVGRDLGFAIGTCGKDAQGAPVSDAMPTVRIPEMVVGGEVR